MFSWPGPGRPEEEDTFVAEAGPARAEPERSISSMPRLRKAGLTRAGQKAAGPKRPEPEVSQR